jgi:predicted transcriptional regulator
VASKLALLAAIRKSPDSISKLALKLHRSRASIDKDVHLLESVGIVESEYVTNPGHGRYRIIKAIDSKPIKLQVETVI